MANQLVQSKDISPLTLTPDDVTSNNLTAVFSGWASAFFWPEGVPNMNTAGVRQVNVQFIFDFQGATSIEILPELAARDTINGVTPQTGPAPAGKVDSAGEAALDVVTLLPANMFSDPGVIDLSFNVDAASSIRFRARITGAGAATLAARVTSG